MKRVWIMSILKHVSGANNTHDYNSKMLNYLTENHKTADGMYVGSCGCSSKKPLTDFEITQKVYHKPIGKQGEHFVLSITPDKPEVKNDLYMTIGQRIASYFTDYQSIYTLHTDTAIRHLHIFLNSVSPNHGKKFSQGPNELNNFKTYCNHVLHDYGFDIINTGSKNLFDNTKYSLKDGFDFLEIPEDISEPFKDVNLSAEYDNCYDNDSCTQHCDSYDCNFDNDYEEDCNEDYFYENDEYFNDYEEDTYMSKVYTPEVIDSNEKKLKKKGKKKNKKKNKLNNSLPNYLINCSKSFTIKVNSEKKLIKAGELMAAVKSKPSELSENNIKLGMNVHAKFIDAGYPTNVVVDESENYIIDFSDEEDSENTTYIGVDVNQH